jgi:hypothetical protein
VQQVEADHSLVLMFTFLYRRLVCSSDTQSVFPAHCMAPLANQGLPLGLLWLARGVDIVKKCFFDVK